MSRLKCKEVFTFGELSDKAKERAREWYRNGAFDFEWWHGVYQNVRDAAKYLGITIDTVEKRQIGGYVDGKWDNTKESQITQDCIYFSGFYSQGDGACFYGEWRASDMKPFKELKADFSKDNTLHALHRELRTWARRYPQAVCTSSRSNSHYSHERSTTLEAILGDNIDYNVETHKPLEECLVTFMHWIYRSLEQEYDYLNSDAHVDDAIVANEYEFDASGRIS
jgi:hypothetical protein